MTNQERTQLINTLAEDQTERAGAREWRDNYFAHTMQYLESLSDEALLEEANV